MNANTKSPLIILTGPTAVGKTRLSVSLAQRIGGEIISADSMQVYRHMNIGSAKITPQEMQGVPHHLIDILEPWESFNIMLFQRYAETAVREICSRGHIPILAGGTGFYIQAVLYGIDFTEEAQDGAYRERLERLFAQQGAESVHDMLRRCDPVSADAIHPHNRKRVIRALEYYHLTGEPISAHNEIQHKKESQYNACYFVLNDDRQRIYERIDRRVEEMLADGLVEEVIRLRAMGCRRDMVSMQGLGYKEILAYLDKEMTLEDAVYRIKRDTRHFAKRQLTWFRRERDVIWIDKGQFRDEEAAVLAFMQEKIKERGIRI